jgi:hypothetical protein
LRRSLSTPSAQAVQPQTLEKALHKALQQALQKLPMSLWTRAMV